MLYYDVSKKNS
jgi:hypothetical protein